jgi:hypothetical protein
MALIGRLNSSQAHRVGLHESSILSVPPGGTFMEMVNKAYQTKQQSVRGLIYLYSTKEKSGHALNIQLDGQRKIFRFIDDNLRICEFSSLEEFNIQFKAYLQEFYPNYNLFQLAFFHSN